MGPCVNTKNFRPLGGGYGSYPAFDCEKRHLFYEGGHIDPVDPVDPMDSVNIVNDIK